MLEYIIVTHGRGDQMELNNSNVIIACELIEQVRITFAMTWPPLSLFPRAKETPTRMASVPLLAWLPPSHPFAVCPHDRFEPLDQI
jgi:hypothetical protein